MQTTPLPADNALQGNVLFYGQPEPLSFEKHGTLGVNTIENPFAFVGKSNMVPLTVTEFAPAALSYPIVFLGDQKMPLAIMGLRQDTNLYVEKDVFRPDAYLPAFVRRYPFVFASQDEEKRMILCIDRAAPMVAENGETPLFENGQPTAFVQNAMQFCTSFETERRRTESFVKLLEEHDLLEVKEAHFRPRNPDGSEGEPQKMADYWGVSEDRLNALPVEALTKLRDNGALGQIYAHLLSLQNWDRLVAMAMDRAQREGVAGNA